MYGIKKKLGSLLPGEGARGALQNVLTVEWSGHKTVLVEVPNAGTSRSNEVEMSGMGDSGGGYGRLMDDEEEERAYLNQPRGYFDQPRSHHYDEDTPPIPPPKPSYDSRSSSYQSYAPQKPPKEITSGPSRPLKSNNPFNSQEDVSDFTIPTHQRAYHTEKKRREDDLFTFDDEPRGWHTFGQGSGKNSPSPWAGRNWGTGNGEGQTSPTSSTGTRHSSILQQAEDPFKN